MEHTGHGKESAELRVCWGLALSVRLSVPSGMRSGGAVVLRRCPVDVYRRSLSPTRYGGLVAQQDRRWPGHVGVTGGRGQRDRHAGTSVGIGPSLPAVASFA